MNRKLLKFSIAFFALCLNFFYLNAEKIIIYSPVKEKQYMDCVDIEVVIFENGCGVTEIPDYAFLGCTSLRKVTLPEGLKKIGFQAFSECSSLQHVNFPASLEDIGSNSFAYCENLATVSFPDSLLHIGHNAFSFCNSLEEIYLPDCLQEIESYAFSDCKSLKKVRFPANDRMLGELILNCCPSVMEVIEPSAVPPTLDCDSFIFDPTDIAAYRRCTLIVPECSIKAYRQSPSWSLFTSMKCSP